jgi:S-adenosylmethionine hydrolase
LAEPRFWRHPVSSTFHGRDILAPVAAQLSLGVPADQLGPGVSDWTILALPRPTLSPDCLVGEVLFADSFGNLLTNIPGESFLSFAGRSVRVRVGPYEVTTIVRTYGEAKAGSIVALVSSSGRLEIAVVEGNAARVLGAGEGTPVEVTPR